MKAVFIVPPKVHVLDITGPAQIFHEAVSNGAPVELFFGSVFPDQAEAMSCAGLSFNKLMPYDQLALVKGDLIFFPGLEFSLLNSRDFLTASRPFQYWLKKQHENGIVLCSICTGAFLLAAAGLLDERECTTHWEFVGHLKKSYPKIKLQMNRLFVHDNGIYTSAGITSGIDLALYLVELYWGAYFAAQIAKEAVIYFRRTLHDSQLSIFTQYRNHIDHRIHQVQDLLTQSIGRKYSIGDLADKVNMSARNLTRLFKKTTEITINAYLEKLRVEHAEKLLGEGHTVQAAALHCGLKSTNQLRNLLRRYGKKTVARSL